MIITQYLSNILQYTAHETYKQKSACLEYSIGALCIRGEGGYCVLSSEKDMSKMLLKWSAGALLASLAALALEGVGSWRRLLARVEPAPGVRGQDRAARMSEKQHTEGKTPALNSVLLVKSIMMHQFSDVRETGCQSDGKD